MRGKLRLVLVVFAAAALFGWWSEHRGTDPEVAEAPAGYADATSERYPAFLPPEAIETLQAIENGGPFPFSRDGTVFQNRERLLPAQPRGYYREYTVITPGSPDRGARRIVAGGDPPAVYYYTDDHYQSFRVVEIAP
jgi:guanyl-specific ribonuclease Sa